MRSILATTLALSLSAGAFIAGCNTPGSICQRMVDAIDAMYTRCGFALQVQIRIAGTPSDCGHVGRVNNPNQLLNTCIPWAQNVDCADLVLDGEGHPILDPSCDFGLLEGRP